MFIGQLLHHHRRPLLLWTDPRPNGRHPSRQNPLIVWVAPTLLAAPLRPLQSAQAQVQLEARVRPKVSLPHRPVIHVNNLARRALLRRVLQKMPKLASRLHEEGRRRIRTRTLILSSDCSRYVRMRILPSYIGVWSRLVKGELACNLMINNRCVLTTIQCLWWCIYSISSWNEPFSCY